MSSDAQALVRQLTEHPEVLESMQHMLSLLRANPPTSMQGTKTTAAAAVTTATVKSHSAQRVWPPRTSYENEERRWEDKTYTSPVPMLAEPECRGRRTASSSSGPPRRSTVAAPSAATAASDDLITTSKKLIDAQRRIAELEKELQRTTQRVDSLSEVVRKQKSELQDAQDRHQLELEETRHAYDAVVRRKDEVQEEALRQLMKSRQLMLSAAKYEAVVAAKKREKENVNYDSSNCASNTQDEYGWEKDKPYGSFAGSAATGGLTSSATNLNARYPSHLLGSGVKRERQDEQAETYQTFVNGDGAAQLHYNQQQPQGIVKQTASESWGTPTNRGRTRQDEKRTGGGDNTISHNASSTYTKTESPEFTTSPTPPTKTKVSTALVGGNRTESRSIRKRRTPRTPSLTNADRIASTYKHSYCSSNSHKTTANSGSASAQGQMQQQRQLPGTNSLKLDSPTPVVSVAWTAGRSLTTSPTPPPAPSFSTPAGAVAAGSAATITGGYGTLSTAATNKQQHHQKPALFQRVAGRLAPVAPPSPQLLSTATLTRAVPNTRSGTSSVVAGGPTRSPSPVNPKRGNAGPRRFVFTGLKDGEPQRLAAVIASVGDDAAVLASELDEVPPASTTHIVLRGTPRSVKALCGVVSGKWLVSPEYIDNSAESGFWLDEMEEGGMRIFPPPLQGQRFLLTVEHDGIRGKLAQVIAYGGGEVLPVYSGKVAQDVVVITSGDDLLRYATEGHM